MILSLVGLAAMACETFAPGDPGNLVPRTVVEDPNLPAIEMNGVRFHAETFGNPANPAIIFLHGGPGGDYRGMLRLAGRYNGYSLADDYFLVYWDQRGCGLSQRLGRGQVTLALYDRDLDTLIARYSPGRPAILIGESWGGMFATQYINENPQKVAGAVLIESGPMDAATMERLIDGISPMDLGAEWLNDYAWNTQFFTPDDHAREDYARLLGMKDGQPKFHQSTTDPEPVWRLGAAANRYITEEAMDDNGKFDFDFTTKLPAFTKPVLFVAGSLSEVLGPSLQRQQVLHYPSASLKVVNGAGHDVAWVKTADVLTHIRAYLDALQTGGIGQ